jgi:hypothetical protein
MRSASLLTLLFLASSARADLPSPRFDRLTPLGASAGSTVEVEVLGADIEEANTLLFDHKGITAKHIKDRKFAVTVAADVPAGTYDARLVGKYGVTNPRLFTVSRGLSEVTEKGPNEDRETAQQVPVPCVINGSSKQGREAVFKFAAKKGQRVVAECFAQRLDSQLDGNLLLTDSEGKQLALNGDYAGKDPLVEFIAAKDGDYFVTINDLSFRGGQPYRLVISDQPQVENIFPRVVQAGKKSEVTVYGRNLGKGAKPSPWTINELPLDALTESITPPDVLKRGQFLFTEHPTGHSVLPTAATCTMHGAQHRGVPMLVTDIPVSLEQEPNDDPTKPQQLKLPVALAGRFDKERDADWYEIEPPENGSYSFEVYCERIAGRADPYLVVLDDKDTRVAELDDFGIRTNAFDGHLRDPQGTVNLNAKKKYRVLVQDRYKRGGARYQYVLVIRKATPDFYPAVIHHQNPGPGGTTVRKGGAVYLDVISHNKEGFSGSITITAEGLPKGLHCAPTTINNDSRGVIVLWADKDAPEWVGPITLTAVGKMDGKGKDITLTREVRPYTRVWNSTDLNSSRPMRELMVAISGETAPFAITPAAEQIEVQAGKKIALQIKCERLFPEVKGNMNIIPLSFPGSIKMAPVTVGEGKSEATVTLEVQANARPGEYTIALTGQAQVPFAKDPKAASRPNTLVPLPSRPITVVVLPAKK